MRKEELLKSIDSRFLNDSNIRKNYSKKSAFDGDIATGVRINARLRSLFSGLRLYIG